LKNFLAAIGRVRHRESLRNRQMVVENRAITTSLFNMVVSERVEEIPKEAIAGV
jgi:hypothetical protein